MDRCNISSTGNLYNLGLLFEQVSEQHNERPAIFFESGYAISYAELSSLSARLARKFLTLGVRRGDIVCISGKKDRFAYAGILACLRIGAGYAMLDDYTPLPRLQRIISTCLPALLFCDFALSEVFKKDSQLCRLPLLISNEGLEESLQMLSDSPLTQTLSVTGDDVAYIMFTSGSTGFPKGVVISHQNVLNFVKWSQACFKIIPDDILTGVNPLYFDNSVFDVYSSLMIGASLASFDRITVRNPGKIMELVDNIGCTLWFSVPSMLIFLSTMRVLNSSVFKSVTRIVFGGEGYPKPKLKQLFEWFGEKARIVNVYGPTECTCICSAYEILKDDFENMKSFAPIGKVAPNFSNIILDGEREVALGEVGELCLLGPNVGKGYYNNPEKSAEVFVQNPLNSFYREIIYRTGDLVRCGPDDGLIYFVGRVDFQVKHMGYRIELEEIEAALNRLEYVDEAAVVHGIANGLSRLNAMVSTSSDVDERKVLDDLCTFLPDYMIPQHVHLVDILPKNQNGKIDRPFIKKRLFKT